jgi:hypothetical protein
MKVLQCQCDSGLRGSRAVSLRLTGGNILNVCVNAIYAGSVDADPAKWVVAQGMLEREIAKVKKAKTSKARLNSNITSMRLRFTESLHHFGLPALQHHQFLGCGHSIPSAASLADLPQHHIDLNGEHSCAVLK